jgi:hypothetical protein
MWESSSQTEKTILCRMRDRKVFYVVLLKIKPGAITTRLRIRAYMVIDSDHENLTVTIF